MAITEHHFQSEQECAENLALSVADALQRDLTDGGAAYLAVSGGKSPIPFFEALSKQPLYWKNVTITLVDERHVPETDPASNAGLVREYLLQHHAAKANFIGLYRHESYERNIGILNEEFHPFPFRFSAVILGMGEDGHTASFFKDSENLASALFDPVNPVSAQTAPSEPKNRITFNFNILTRTDNLYLSFSGEKKRAVYEAAKKKLSANYPISAFLHKRELFLRVYRA